MPAGMPAFLVPILAGGRGSSGAPRGLLGGEASPRQASSASASPRTSWTGGKSEIMAGSPSMRRPLASSMDSWAQNPTVEIIWTPTVEISWTPTVEIS